MLISPNKAKAAFHGCHCPGDMAVRMRTVPENAYTEVSMCHLLLCFFADDHCQSCY